MTFRQQTIFIALTVWIVAIAGLAVGNLGDPNIWYDESLQICAALGQHHFANYGEPRGDWQDAIYFNHRITWDADAYVLILHNLAKITTQPWIFRLASLLFFCLMAGFFTLLALHWLPDSPLAPFAGFIFILPAHLCYYAFEIRPYTLEMLHLAVMVYLVCRPEALGNKKRALAWGCLAALTMASRYSSIFPAVLGTAFLGYSLWSARDKTLSPRLGRFLCFLAPNCLAGLLMLCSLSIQWKYATAITAYHKRFLFWNAPEEILNWGTLLLWLPFLALLVLRQFFPENRKYDRYLLFTLLLNLLRLGADLAGLLPYSLRHRFNLSSYLLLCFSCLPLLLFIRESILCRLQGKTEILTRVIPIALTLLLVTLAISQTATFSRDTPDTSIRYLRSLPAEPPPKILASFRCYPALRYAFEFGPLQDRFHWLENISYYGPKIPGPERQGWVVKKRFEFIASQNASLTKQHYQLAIRKNFSLILESTADFRVLIVPLTEFTY